MRDWTKLLLIVCVVVLGAGMFVLERRISGLEAELRAAQATLTAVAAPAATPAPFAVAPQVAETDRAQMQPQIRIVTPRDGKTTHRILIAPPVGSLPAPNLERQPSGVINGVPFYHNLLGQSDR